MIKWKRICLAIIMLTIVSVLLFDANAATITSCTLDRTVYNQGGTGYISLTVYNDKDAMIRVYEITATINYFYADGTTYLQTFFTNATLPIVISQGQSQTFYVPFVLPTNIAPGYAHILVRAKTEIWNEAAQRWYQSDNPTAEIYPYIESPYKQQYEQQRAINEQLQDQIEDQENTINQLQSQLENLQTAYNTMTLLVYVFITITIGLGIAIAFVMKMLMKPRAIPQPLPQ
ncbi:MAG: hypothetical protein QW670_06135 [Candidatus Bathyarchaeia archaeon]